MLDYIKIAQEVCTIEAEAIQNLCSQLDDNFCHAIDRIYKSAGRVVICGMGKSGLIGKKIVATLASTGTPSFFMHPAEAFHGDLGMLRQEDIFVAISKSGETDEVIRLLPTIREMGNCCIAICGKKDSTLVKNSDIFLSIYVKREACSFELVPTSSTTTTLVLGDALALTLMKKRNFKSENFARLHPGGNLGKRLLTRIGDIMKVKNLPLSKPEDSFRELILTMTKGMLGLALVCENQKVIGIFTDGDLRRAWEKYDTLDNKKAIELMQLNPKTISINSNLITAEQFFLKYKITTLIVVDQNKNLKGILQIYDLP